MLLNFTIHPSLGPQEHEEVLVWNGSV